MKTFKNLIGLIYLFLGVIASLQAQNINKPNIQAPGGLQVNSFTGNLFYQRTDFIIPGEGLPIDVTFSYNSYRDTLNIGFGFGWTFSYNMYYFFKGDTLYIERMDGRRDAYRMSENGQSFKAPTGIFDVLTQYEGNKYLLTSKDGMKYFFEDANHKKLTKIQDPNGNVLNLSYSSGLLAGITNASGRRISFSWQNGLLTSITEDNSNPVRTAGLIYDGKGFLTQLTHPDGQRIAYQYGTNEKMVLITDKNDNEYQIEYNSGEQVKSITSCLSVQRFTYNVENRKTYVIDENISGKQITTYVFDENENVIQKEGNCCGFNTEYEYDKDKNVTKRIDGNGNQSNYTYDAKGNLLSASDALGKSVQMQYEPAYNRVTQVTDKRSNTTQYQYDAKGNLSKVNQPLSISQEFTYDAQGNILTSKDGKGNLIGYQYDAAGNITQMQYPIGSENYTYDALGNLLTSKDANGNTANFAYDELNRLSEVKDALNNQVKYRYDGNGNLITQTDPKNQDTRYGYDALNRLVAVDLPINAMTMYGYDGVGNLISVVDANGHTNLYEYNAKNLVETETDGIGQQTHYTYDNVGNLTSRTDANGKTTTYQYDVLNRLVKKTYEGNTDEYAYDANGNLTSCKNNFIEMNFEYDALNRLVKKTVPTWGKTISYTYDANGNRSSMTDPSGTTTYTYDANNRLVSLKDPKNQTISFEYDAAGRMTKQTNFNGTYSTYTYDAADRLTALKHFKANNQVFASYAYTYDANGNRLTMTTTEGIHNYTYDAADRVTGVKYANGTTESYTHDKTGNRTQLTRNGQSTNYAYDNGDRLQTAGEATFSFDDNGNLISKTQNGETTTYAYDGENRLTQITLPNGQVISYQYDPFGNRIRKAQGNAETRYLLDGQNVLQELDAQGNTTARYTAGLGLDTWLSMERQGTTYLYHKDGLGSVTALTNPTAQTTATYTYDIYGNLQSQSGNLTNPYTYTGREYDTEAALYYYRSRYYDAKVGRFIKKDLQKGFKEKPMSLNDYNYADSNPINGIDPLGLSSNIFEKARTMLNEVVGGFNTIGDLFSRPWYGRYCGPGNIGGTPIDRLDTLCYIHDNLYDLAGANGPKDAFLNTECIVIFADAFLAYEALKYAKIANHAPSLVVGKLFEYITYFKIAKKLYEVGKRFIETGELDICGTLPGSQDPNDDGSSGDIFSTIGIAAFDPNDITGPSGYGQPQWVSKNAGLPYTIRFENDPDFATAAAQNVIIRLPIDSTVDIQSLRLGDFGFGNFVFSVPQNSNTYSARLDLSDSLGVLVDVLAGVDLVRHEIFWIFESKDPVTGLVPLNAQAGFLPINDSLTGNGEGFVNFTLLPDKNVGTGDSLIAQATIVFDVNEPILTNRWVNLLDAQAPTSKVKPLPATSEEVQVTLSWSGQDDPKGVGLKNYALYVSKDNEPYQLLAENLDTTAYVFQGEAGATYSFFSRAQDFVGNREDFKAKAEATITLGVADSGPQITRLLLVDAKNDKIITEIQEGQLINMDTLASRELSILVITQPSLVGSVAMKLSGGLSRNQVENTAPYTLFGDQNGGKDYLGAAFCNGTYRIEAIPYPQPRQGGKAGNTFVRNFTLTGLPNIEQVVLVSATTQADLVSFKEGLVIDLDAVGSALNVRADAPCARSVVFVLKDAAGNVLRTQTEGVRPFTLFGDNGPNNYIAWTPALGNYVLEINPYSENGGKGVLGNALRYAFSVEKLSKPTLDAVVLINAANDQEIRNFQDGMEIDLQKTGDQLNILAKFSTQGSIRFVLKNAAGTVLQEKIENIAPFAFFGDQNGDFNPWTPALGDYILEVTPYTLKKAEGKEGEQEVYRFRVIDGSSLRLDEVLLANATTNRIVGDLNANLRINLDEIGTKISVLVEANQAKSVRFLLKNAAGVLIHEKIESQKPFTLFGDQNGTFTPWMPLPGNYSLEIIPYPEPQAKGTVGLAETFALQVVKGLSLDALTLVNAATDREIGALIDNMIIDLTETGNELSIWAKSSLAKSVKFVLKDQNGQVIHQKTESSAPYTLFGDNPGGDFISWKPGIGRYTLEATPYALPGAGGQAGKTEVRNFELIQGTTTATQGHIARIYPNTTQDYVYLDFSAGYSGNIAVEVRYPSGALIMSQAYEVGTENSLIRIDLTRINLIQGVYYLHVSGEGLAPYAEKVVKY